MRVLVACEFSGRVRDAFIRNGHDALSCDLLPTEQPGPHYQGDVRDLLDEHWDMMIAFPPCTYLACSGNRWYAGTPQREEALDFVRLLMNADIPSIVIENPVGVISSRIRKPDQIIQPWMFGHPETKATCLWLKNSLSLSLSPTCVVDGREPRIHHMNPGKSRSRLRSITYQGIADAMGDQWGGRA